MILSNETIISIVENRLNDISQTLYDSQDIPDKIVFNGTVDITEYEQWTMMEYDMDTKILPIPIVLSSTNFSQLNQDYLRYEEEFEINIYGYMKFKESIQRIFDEYTNIENTANRVEKVDTLRIEKVNDRMNIGREMISPQNGSLDERFEGTFKFAWSVMEGMITSDDTIIKIDGVEIPYNMISISSSKSNIITQPLTPEGIDNYLSSNRNWEISMNLPVLETNVKTKELFNHIFNNRYNVSYTLTIEIGNDITFTAPVQMVLGTFVDPKPTIYDFDVMFKRANKQRQIWINDELIPVIEFKLDAQATVDSIVSINSDSTKSSYLSSNNGISMVLPLDEDDNTSIINTIYDDIMDGDFSEPYRIRVKRNSKEVEFTMLIVEGSYSFSVDGDDTITISLTEYEVE